MRLRRLRAGELLALAGAIAACVALALDWYGTPGRGALNAWDTFGAAIVLLALAIAAALLLCAATLLERSPALPIAAAVWSTLFSIIATVAMIVRVLERPDGASSAAAGAWLALGGAVAMLLGSWQSMRDERTECYEPPQVRPRQAPPAG